MFNKALIPATLASALMLSACAATAPKVTGPEVELPKGLRAYAVDDSRPMTTYRAAAVDVTRSLVASQAENLGLNNASIKEERDYVVATQGKLVVQVHKQNGILLYQDLATFGGANDAVPAPAGEAPARKPAPPAVPDEVASIHLAEAYIAEHGLVRGEAHAFYQSNEMKQSIADGDGTMLSNTVLQREIVFKRQVDGVVLHGAGSQVSVFIGDKGHVNGAFVDWPVLEKGTQVEVKDGVAALTNLQARLDHLNGQLLPEQQVRRFTVERMKLGLVGHLNADGSRDIVPTYAVLGDAQSDKRLRTGQLVFLTAADAAPVPDRSAQAPVEAPGNVPPPIPAAAD